MTDNIVDITSKVSGFLSKREVMELVSDSLDAGGTDAFKGFVFLAGVSTGGIATADSVSVDGICELIAAINGYQTILNEIIVTLMLEDRTEEE